MTVEPMNVQSSDLRIWSSCLVPTEEHPLYFLHIPKTAGTTLYNAMDDRFPVDHICPDRFLPQLLKRSPDSLKQCRFFRGHFGDSLKNFVDRPLTYVTVLRDPIDRCISQYEDVRRVSNNFLYQRVNDHRMTFADFARDAETHIAINNLQARNLAFDWMPEQMEGNFNLIRRGIAGTSLGIPDDELLDIAKERLSRCTVVGIVERFQETTTLLSYRFCWYPIQPPRRLNQSANRLRKETLDEATLDAVREKNQVDEALYRYATDLFESQLNQMMQDISISAPTLMATEESVTQEGMEPEACSARVDNPSEREQVRDAHHIPTLMPALITRYGNAAAQQSAFASILHVSMRNPAAGDNWYAREGLEDDCTVFRWTGPGTTSTVYVPLQAQTGVECQAITVQVYLVRAIAPDVLQSLALEVNGTSIPLQCLTQWETNTVLHGTIPADAVSEPPHLTCLTLTVNRTDSIQTIAPHSTDKRHVGVAVSYIGLFPINATVPDNTDLRLFPGQDDLWTAVRDYVRSHLQPEEAIAAPKEFLQPFPAQFRDVETLSNHDNSASLPQWAVIAKHLAHQIPASTLRSIVARMHPVFSNPVFIVLSTRSDLDSVPYFSDDVWNDTAHFLVEWIKPGESLHAPKEFLFRVPDAQFLGDPLHQDSSTHGHSDWFVLHKGRMDEYSDGVLKRAVKELRPVFANLVFVIFSSRTELRQVPFWTRDMRAFWKVYLRRRWLKRIDQSIQRP